MRYDKKNRVGDHKWWITNNQNFIKHYPKFKIKYNINKIIGELIENSF